MSTPVGRRLGRYEIRTLLGVGGMGEVYLAQDTQLLRSVALKLLPPDFTRNAERLRRFKQEALAASALNIRTFSRFTRSDQQAGPIS